MKENVSIVFQIDTDFDLLHCIKYIWPETSKVKKKNTRLHRL